MGVVEAIARRESDGRPMVEVSQCEVAVGQGIDGEAGRKRKRGLTLLSRDAWDDVRRELQADLPWHSRRANLLVSGFDLAAAIGRELSIGPVRIHVHGETKPCGIMDQAHTGLRTALQPNCRGGVYGEVLAGGTIRVGDRVQFVHSSTPALTPFTSPPGQP